MIQPLWKRLLSYLFEWHIESTSSEYNPHLYVSLKQGRYQLCTANAVYSYDDLYDNFSRSFRQIDLDQQKIEKVLVLGLGLGSIPFMLEKIFHKRYHYHLIELDEAVIYLANKYVLSRLESSFTIQNADAFAYIMQTEEQYDMICMDVFQDALVPSQFETDEFLEKLKQCLNPEGILLYNRLYAKPKDKERTRIFFERQFKSIFESGTYLDVGGNWMLLNSTACLR